MEPALAKGGLPPEAAMMAPPHEFLLVACTMRQVAGCPGQTVPVTIPMVQRSHGANYHSLPTGDAHLHQQSGWLSQA